MASMEACFDNEGNTFVSIAQNTLKVFSVKDKALSYSHVEKTAYTAVALASAAAASEKSEKRKKVAVSRKLWAALGSTDGSVHIWDLTECKAVATAKPFAEPVTLLAVDSHRQLVYAASTGRSEVTSLSLRDGKIVSRFDTKLELTAWCLTNDGNSLFTAGGKLKVWSLASEIPSVSAKFIAPAATVSSVRTSPDDRYAICTDGGSDLSIYDLQSGSSKKKAAALTVTCHEGVVEARFGDASTVFARSKAGNVFAWTLAPNAASASLIWTLKCTDAAAPRKIDRVLAFALPSARTVAVARAVATNPLFEVVDVEGGDGLGAPKAFKDVTLKAVDKRGLLKAAGEEPLQGDGDKVQFTEKVAGHGDAKAAKGKVQVKTLLKAVDTETAEVPKTAVEAEKVLQKKIAALLEDAPSAAPAQLDGVSVDDALKEAIDGERGFETLLIDGLINSAARDLTEEEAVKAVLGFGELFGKDMRNDKIVNWLTQILVKHGGFVARDQRVKDMMRRLEKESKVLVEAHLESLRLKSKVALVASLVKKRNPEAAFGKVSAEAESDDEMSAIASEAEDIEVDEE